MRTRRRASGIVEYLGTLAFSLLGILLVIEATFALHAQSSLDTALEQGAFRAGARDASIDDGVAVALALAGTSLGASGRDIAITGADRGTVVVLRATGTYRLRLPGLGGLGLPVDVTRTSPKERFRAPLP